MAWNLARGAAARLRGVGDAQPGCGDGAVAQRPDRHRAAALHRVARRRDRAHHGARAQQRRGVVLVVDADVVRRAGHGARHPQRVDEPRRHRVRVGGDREGRVDVALVQHGLGVGLEVGDLAGEADEVLAGAGRDAGAGAPYEHGARDVLQRPHPLRDRGGRQVQLAGRRLEGAGVDDGGEGGQLGSVIHEAMLSNDRITFAGLQVDPRLASSACSPPCSPASCTGLTLIVAIGAQNAFVLRQGIRREHVGAVALLCSVSDAVLILAGVTGIGTIVERAPVVLDVVRWAGAAFLLGVRRAGAAARRASGRAARHDRWPAGRPAPGADHRGGPHLPQPARLPRHRPAARLDRQPARRPGTLGLRVSVPSSAASCGSSAWRTARAAWRRCSPGPRPGGSSTG